MGAESGYWKSIRFDDVKKGDMVLLVGHEVTLSQAMSDARPSKDGDPENMYYDCAFDERFLSALPHNMFAVPFDLPLKVKA